MPEGAVLEGQEIAEIKAPVDEKVDSTPIVEEAPPEIIPDTKDSSAEEAITGKSEAEASLENDSDIAEKAKQEVLVKGMGEFFNAPQSAIEKGLKADMSLLSPDDYKRQVEAHIVAEQEKKGIKREMDSISEDDELQKFLLTHQGLSVAEANKMIAQHNEENKQFLKDHAEKTGGITFPGRERSRIFVRKNEDGLNDSTDHEITHAMGTNDDGEGTGFMLANGEFRNVNEGATQLLTLAYEHPDLTVDGLFHKIFVTKEIKTSYKPFVGKVLTGIHLTEGNENPFTIKDLAKHYFSEDNISKPHLMMWDLVSKVREDKREQVKSWFENDFKSEEIGVT